MINFLNLDPPHSFPRRQYDDVAKITEEKRKQLLWQTHVAALQDFLFATVRSRDVHANLVVQNHWILLPF
jgi:hypothetical protein